MEYEARTDAGERKREVGECEGKSRRWDEKREFKLIRGTIGGLTVVSREEARSEADEKDEKTEKIDVANEEIEVETNGYENGHATWEDLVLVEGDENGHATWEDLMLAEGEEGQEKFINENRSEVTEMIPIERLRESQMLINNEDNVIHSKERCDIASNELSRTTCQVEGEKGDPKKETTIWERRYTKESDNVVTDLLSRIPRNEEEGTEQDCLVSLKDRKEDNEPKMVKRRELKQDEATASFGAMLEEGHRNGWREADLMSEDEEAAKESLERDKTRQGSIENRWSSEKEKWKEKREEV